MIIRRKQFGLVCAFVLASTLFVALTCGRAIGQDLTSNLSEAEATVAAAKVEVDERQAEAAPLKARYAAAQKYAAPARARLHRASTHLADLEAGQRSARQQASAALLEIEAEQQAAASDHDESVRSSIGLALAALVIGAIALGWGWFRASAAVAYLTRIELGQAIGLCVAGGFLSVVIGTLLSQAEGLVGAIGVAVVCLGLALPVAFLLARHSAEVQRGRSRPLLGRERLSGRVTQGLAALFAIVFLFALGAGIFAGESNSREVSAELQREANGIERSAPALAKAEASVARLKAAAAEKLATLNRREEDLRAAKRKLGHAEARLADAENDRRHFQRRLVALEAQEIREREAEERAAAKLVAREEHQARVEAEEAEEEAATECSPNYSGCLDPTASDYDCEGGSGDGPLYTGTVEVIGVDEYDLDRDGDGIGCDD